MFRCGKGCGGFNSWMKHNTRRFAARALKFVSLAVRPVVATTSSFSKRVSRFSSSFSSSSSSAFSSSSSSLGASAFGSIFGHKRLFHSPGFHQSFKAQSAKWIGKGSSIQSHYSQYCTGGSGCTTKSSCSKQNYQYINGKFFQKIEFLMSFSFKGLLLKVSGSNKDVDVNLTPQKLWFCIWQPDVEITDAAVKL